MRGSWRPACNVAKGIHYAKEYLAKNIVCIAVDKNIVCLAVKLYSAILGTITVRPKSTGSCLRVKGHGCGCTT
jgi:hypothetical protein